MVNKYFRVILPIILIAITFSSCRNKNSNSSEGLYWEILSSERDLPDLKANISYPYCFGGDTTATIQMNREIFDAIALGLVEYDDYISVDSMLTMLYEEKSRDKFLSLASYELLCSSDIHTAEHITSVMLSTYYYTGGANGINSIKYLNFNTPTGDIIPADEIIVLDNALLEKVRRRFAQIRNISLESSKESANLFVAPKELPYPEQIGFNSQGVVFFYNHYEVAPRSEGTTEVIIPYEEVIFIN